MTQPVLSLASAIVRVTGKDGKEIGKGYIVPPWNSFFQQFTQKPAAVVDVDVGPSPFEYTPNTLGQLVIDGGVLSERLLIRGDVEVPMGGNRVIPVSIGDTVRLTYSVLPTVYFLEL